MGGWALGGWLTVTFLAWFANVSGNPWLSSLFSLAVLAPPLFLLEEEELRSLVSFRKEGWPLAFLLLLAVLLAPYLGLVLMTRGYLKAFFIHPDLKGALGFWGGKMLVASGLAAAEELFFRGYLQEGLFRRLWGTKGIGRRKDALLTYKNLASSLLFALAHVISYGSLLRLGAFFSSLLLGWVVERSERSLWPAALLHTVSNVAGSWFWLIISLNFPLS